MARKLTLKQQKFAEALATASSQTEAARVAGYDPDRASRTAYENVMKRDVMAAAAEYAKQQGLDLSREALERELATAALAAPADPVLWQHKLNALQQIAKLRRYIDTIQPTAANPVNVTLVLGEKQLLITSSAAETATRSLPPGE